MTILAFSLLALSSLHHSESMTLLLSSPSLVSLSLPTFFPLLSFQRHISLPASSDMDGRIFSLYSVFQSVSGRGVAFSADCHRHIAPPHWQLLVMFILGHVGQWELTFKELRKYIF